MLALRCMKGFRGRWLGGSGRCGGTRRVPWVGQVSLRLSCCGSSSLTPVCCLPCGTRASGARLKSRVGLELVCASWYAAALSHLDACTRIGRWASPVGWRWCGGWPWGDPEFRWAGGGGPCPLAAHCDWGLVLFRRSLSVSSLRFPSFW